MANQPPQKKQHTLDKFFNKKQNREIETQNEMENSTEIIEDSLENQVPTDLGENFPAQPIIKFPKTSFGLQLRAFQKEWYNTFPWIEYSTSRNSAFCFACRKFINVNSEAKYIEATFITSGFNNWKRAMEPGRGFIKHLESSIHQKVCKRLNKNI